MLNTLRRAAAPRARAARGLVTLIMGPPGGGKGTLSKKIVREFDVAHLSTGDLLRAHVRDGTPLGARAKARMDAGALVPDDLIVDLVVAELRGGAARAKAHVLLAVGAVGDEAEALSPSGARAARRVPAHGRAGRRARRGRHARRARARPAGAARGHRRAVKRSV